MGVDVPGLEPTLLNGVFVAILAHGLIGISLVWDKVLLKRRDTTNLVSYVFWLGALSVFGLVLIPFGFRMPAWSDATMAFAAGALDLVASYFYYWALKAGQASEEVAAIGGFAPVATVLIAIPLLNQPVGGQLLGFALMTAGGFAMFFADGHGWRSMLPKVVAASAGFGLLNVLQKIVFNHTNFVTGFVFYTIGTTAGAGAMLLLPSWRRQIFQHAETAEPKNKFWYIVNRVMAGIGSFLVVFAISRANPAIVEAISGVRYVIVFIGAFAITKLRPQWFREDFSRWALAAKSGATALVTAGLALVGVQGGRIGSGPA